MVTWTPVRKENQSERKSMRDKVCDSEDMIKNTSIKNTEGYRERERGEVRWR